MGRRNGLCVGFDDTDSFFLRSNLTSVGVLVRKRSCYCCCYDSCSFLWTVLRANFYIVGEASCGYWGVNVFGYADFLAFGLVYLICGSIRPAFCDFWSLDERLLLWQMLMSDVWFSSEQIDFTGLVRWTGGRFGRWTITAAETVLNFLWECLLSVFCYLKLSRGGRSGCFLF